jgi:sugar transferase EpsL
MNRYPTSLARMRRSRALFDGAKRVGDVLISAVAIVILAPVILAVALAIRVRMGRPIIFRQERVGLHGRSFIILKFRTLAMGDAHCCGEPRTCVGMQTAADSNVGRFPRFLRRTGLDELPQFLAILRGDMSLIGPRPLLVRYLSRYTPMQARRHEVRPGITGWAQVNGRTDLSWAKRLALDVYYVDHRSFSLDAKIAWRTIAAIWGGKGFSQEGTGTGPEFLGREERVDICPVTSEPVGDPANR